MEQEPGGHTLGTVLESLRKRRRFTRLALSATSGVSTTYIAQIEEGVDSRSGREIHPSPPILHKLADALGDGNPEDAERFYEELMAAAGYLPGQDSVPAPKPLKQASEEPRSPRLAENSSRRYQAPSDGRPSASSMAPPPPAPDARSGAFDDVVTVPLRDPRLHTHFKEVMTHWEQLGGDEQQAVLSLMRLIDGNRGRP